MTLRIILILAGLNAFGPLAIDLYLPSFDLIANEFNTLTDNVQLSLSVYLIGLAIGQILYGPLTDKLGRKPPLIVGACIFIVASLGCALASSLNWLITLRFLQALGGCAGMVISRAVVRDLCDPNTAAKVFSQLMLVNGITPMVAPLLGSLLLVYFSWQTSFYFCFIFAISIAITALFWLPETLSANAPRPAVSTAFKQYQHLFKERKFLGYSFVSGFILAGLFIYIGSSHFLFVELHGLSNTQYAWIFALNSLSIMLSAQLNHFLLAKHSSDYWIAKVLWVSLIAALLLILAHYLQAPVWLFTIPIIIFMGSLGVLLPNITACAMAVDARQAGSASALMGTIQFAIAASLSGMTAWLQNGTAYPTALMLACSVTLSMIITYLTTKQQQATSVSESIT
ncbi:multidrug effflux MFS transporter [Entomomonas asaccharolytica]|uniref:Bcr/CflA family efflux transporter n=1 Tax=Entomomonas asaccharolytica TaxID=2785331 RepID=A0A974NHG8_9GAMM|nr:multidrug effflux MFS transporter [Entomomonas asaccharolytica]QQP86699.1 multidrug effflux MFS transporter [Entomomonas asaccharolytica]